MYLISFGTETEDKKSDKPLVQELAKERILCLKELYKNKKL